MLNPRFAVWIFSAGVIALGAGVVSGQDYPNKPIRIIAVEAGGTGDFLARQITPGMANLLGQPVIVENRPDAISGEIAAKATPDGHTLLLKGGGFWVDPLFRKLPYDPVRDFLPISLVTRQPNVLVVPSSLPVNSVQELIALAKARPGELNYAASGAGGSNHLAAELFKAMSGTNIVHIRYKGTGPALNDVIGGQVQLMFAPAPAAMPHVKAGRLRALAVSSAEPSALAPGLPTVAASGLPGYEAIAVTAMFAPAKTPGAIIMRLNQEVVRVLNRPDVKEKLSSAGSEVVGSSPKELAAVMKSDVIKFDKLIKDVGIRAE